MEIHLVTNQESPDKLYVRMQSDNTSNATCGTGAEIQKIDGPIPKRQKSDDPLAAYRTCTAERSTVDSLKSTQSNNRNQFQYDTYDQFKIAVCHDIAKYESLLGPFDNGDSGESSTQDSNESVFDPLAWWGKQSGKLPLLAKLAKQILVIPASSAESERHFSTAGKITRKDRAKLSSSTVEASVLVAQALKKGLISFGQ
jgi:hypothetical protein